MILAIFLVVLLGAILAGVPVAFALLLSGIAMMVYLGEFSFTVPAETLLSGVDATLMAIPFFILAGEIMNAGGLSRRIVELPMKLVGHKQGGLGYVAILAAMIMASLSGSAVADTAAVAAMLIPMMKAAGYPEHRSAGLIGAAGIIAPIIPPSIPFIIFGVTSGVSITRLFMAGIVPGILMGVALAVLWSFQARHMNLIPHEKAAKGEVKQALKNGFWALLLPVIIVGGFRARIFTPTEAGAVAAVYALFVAMVIYRELKWRDLYPVFLASARTTAVVMLLVAAAKLASYYITVTQLPDALIALLEPLIDSPKLLLAVIMVAVFVIGMVMDLTPTVLILTPVLMPLVKTAGIDPVYFGVLFILNCSIGLITPPVGNVLNVITGVTKLPFDRAARGMLPYVALLIGLLIFFMIFEEVIIVPYKFLMG